MVVVVVVTEMLAATPAPTPETTTTTTIPTTTTTTTMMTTTTMTTTTTTTTTTTSTTTSTVSADSYVLKSSGTCAPEERILDATECMQAAQALGKKDRDGAISGEANGLRGRPFGCTWHNFGNVELWG